jgi:hypothetical protein
MKKGGLLIALVLFIVQVSKPQSFDNGFSFHMPYDDSTTVNFLPKFPQKSITEKSYVSTDSSGNFIVKGEPYRFFGVNLTTRGAFPTKEDAPYIAGRMRKFGINLVRFHHIDNPWSNGSLFHNIEGTRDFNQNLLDRLDYFISQLKENGIYVNMNLNVSRTFEEQDGVVHADSLHRYGKGVTQFDTTLIRLQKEYAKKLLGHVNPYTGIPLAEDPVLAMVETINENSLFRLWYSGDLKPYKKGGKLPVYYNNELDSLWNGYLAERYDSTEDLRASWNENIIRGDTIYKEDFEKGLPDDWTLELHERARGSVFITPDAASRDSAALVKVANLSSESWHCMFKQTGNSISKDSTYEVIIKAKAEHPSSIRINVMRDISPWTYYTGHNINLDTVYSKYKVSFKAPENNKDHLRISFTFRDTGKFYFDGMVFKRQSKYGIKENESLEKQNIGRIARDEIMTFTKARVKDMMRFYSKVQKDFLIEMKSLLKDTLGVKAPVTGTNMYSGPEDLYVQNTMDYIDNHSYWDHPSFPGKPWSPTDWYISNTPMLTSNSGTIEELFSGFIVKNKPYTVSEYNHAFPNQYQSEMLPLIISYLSYNDADALMLFTYSSSWNWSQNMIDGYFDTHRNSSLMANYPLYSYVFRNNLINASGEVSEIHYNLDKILEMPYISDKWWETHVPYDKNLAYTRRMEVVFDNPDTATFNHLPPVKESPYTLNNGQIYWDKKGIFKINTRRFTSICGYLDQFPSTATDHLILESGSEFGAVNWLSLTDSSLQKTKRSVLSLASNMMNTGMKWDGTTTVHNNWGKSPALIDPLNLELKLKTSHPALIVYPMDEFAEITENKADTLIADDEGYVTLNLDQQVDKTLWYGIKGTQINRDTTNVDDTVTSAFREPGKLPLKTYPNPASEKICFEWSSPGNEKAIVRIYDITGSLLLRRRINNKEWIDIRKFEPGIYPVSLNIKKQNYRGRIVIK